MTKKRPRVNIGDTDENADWIKTPENRESEQRIHDNLAKKLEETQDAKGPSGATPG